MRFQPTINFNWWGRILGAFFGYLIAGSIGAFIGIIVGNFFDQGLTKQFSRTYWSDYQEKRTEIQATFFEVTFALLGHLAKVDGRVSEQEIQMAQALMEEMQLGNQQKSQAREFFKAGKAANFDVYATVERLRVSCYRNPELLKLFLDILYRAAKVDGLTTAKVQSLNTIFRQLGFSPLNQQYQFYQDFSDNAYRSNSSGNYQRHARNTNYSSIDQAYALLEISKTANKQEVKKAYRKLISRNHPDKLIAQGLPESMIKMANEKTQKLTKAYDDIISFKGW